MSRAELLCVKDMNIFLNQEKRSIRACCGINLSVPENSVVSIVGESGCGKSLTCSAIGGLLPAPKWTVEADITFNGRVLEVQKERDMSLIRGKDITYVAQDPMNAFDQRMKVEAHFREMRGNREIPAKELHERATGLLAELNLRKPEEVLKSYPFQLSGGMLQRVLIGMAVSCNPRLLIADEPTTALDITNQQEMLILLTKLRRERQMSILLVSHDLNVVSRISDTVNVMYAGSIVESGSVQNVLQSPAHPYTRALIRSRPAFSKEKLPVLTGQPPTIHEERIGCPFAPRCAFCTERCRQEIPALREHAQGHMVACFREDL